MDCLAWITSLCWAELVTLHRQSSAWWVTSCIDLINEHNALKIIWDNGLGTRDAREPSR